MQELAYVNDHFCPLEEARISIQDRGFLFADGVYEVVVTYAGKPFRLPQHLERFRRSIAAIRIQFDIDASGVADIVNEGVRSFGLPRTQVYMQVTRGVAPRAHPFPENTKPTFVAYFKAPAEVSPEKRRTGIRLISTPDLRWALCRVKSVGLLANVLAKQAALDAGAYDAVFVTDDGRIHEASASNVFLIKGGVLITPDKQQRILHGITREYVMECAKAAGIKVEERAVLMDELRAADEVFITSTTSEILGAVQLDGKKIGTGQVGSLTRAIHERFLKGVESAG